MYYEINISKDGKHFFATSERSVDMQSTLESILKVFVEKFPESEGYKINVTNYQTVGKIIDYKELLKK
ncbi:hypothetical protein [Bacillus sp. CH_203]|uniref:hypothetical protein n=1 Tax=Bacillus sp. CH_203 TaxID=2978216 RepID=UPI0030F9FF27|nr:hypothetical protein [Bacillus cereus]